MDTKLSLDGLADSYRDQGYDVVVHPGPDQLPAFAKDFRIELVARRARGGALVMVKKNRDEFAADTNAPRYAEVTGAQPHWRFDLAILEGEDPNARDFKEAREFSTADISRALDQASELNRLGFPRAALLSAWGALEAAMRARLRAMGQKAGWDSAPRQMLRELYSAGEFAPEEFWRVDATAQLRNQLAHGFTPKTDDVEPSVASDVQLLGDVARRLMSESQPVPQPA